MIQSVLNCVGVTYKDREEFKVHQIEEGNNLRKEVVGDTGAP